MKYPIGTEFHSFFDNRPDEPMYGKILNIKYDEYLITWYYHEKSKRDNITAMYTDKLIEDIRTREKKEKWVIKYPIYEILDEELFEL